MTMVEPTVLQRKDYRGAGIRTRDLSLPKRALHQAELHPVRNFFNNCVNRCMTVLAEEYTLF